MKYVYLATSVFLTTISAMCAALMEHLPNESSTFGAALVSSSILALACFGMYQMELIKEDHRKALPCK